MSVVIHVGEALDQHMRHVVVGSGSKQEVVGPVGLVLVDVEAQEMFYHGIGPFSLSVCLGVVCGQGIPFDAK